VDLILLMVLLALSAFFSGSETAYFSLRPSQLARLAASPGAGQRVAALVRRAPTLLSAVLIGNLLVNTAATVVATSLCVAWLGQRGLAVAVPALTVLLLLVGEITPKLLALRYRERLAVLAQRPLMIWVAVIRPMLAFLTVIIEHLLRLLPLERTGGRSLSSFELETACDLAVEDGTLTETDGRFLARLLMLQQLEVRQIMTPRPDVVTMDAGMTRAEILITARRAGFNRYPVTRSEGAQPVGFFHLKDLLARDRTRPLAADLRPLLFVPESKDVAALISELRTGGSHLAAVVDEHGDFTGIVTLASCLQALLGPIGDSGRHAEREVVSLGPRSWVLGGRLDLRRLQETCGIALPTSRDYTTLAGFLMARLGRIPRPGDRWEEAGARFSVLDMEGHKVVQVQVDLLPVAAREGPS
jgi:putative hemolysin